MPSNRRVRIWPGNPLMLAVLLTASFPKGMAEPSDFEFLRTADGDGFALELSEEDDQCAISLEGSQETVPLGVPYPCGFVRANDEMKAQREYYDGVGHVFIVAGPLTCQQTYEHVSTEPSMKCSDHGQAVMVNEGELKLRPKQHIPGLFCHHRGFDEKDYYGYAHDFEDQ